jgi:hypothetical protein
MAIDWTLTARWLAPILALFVGAALNRYLERRQKLLVYLAHSNAVAVRPPEGAAFSVHTHSIVVRNAGGKAAVNVRLGHFFLPSFSVFPNVNYEVSQLPDGGSEILFPTLVPGEQVTVAYLYFPPRLWSEVHSYTKSDDGFAREVRVLPTPQPARWLRAIAWCLIALGSLTLVTFLIQIARLLWRIRLGA